MFSINPLRFFRRTQAVVAEAYRGASKMGIADSMSESGLSFVHSDKDTADQANNMVSEYEMDTLVSELTVADMVFGNSFVVLDPAESEFDFLEQLSPKYMSIKKNDTTGRHEGWKYQEGELDAPLTLEQVLHMPVNRLAGSTWGTSPLQPLTRILDLKGNIEVNLDHLVTRYLVTAIIRVLPFLPRFSMCVSTNLALTNLFSAL